MIEKSIKIWNPCPPPKTTKKKKKSSKTHKKKQKTTRAYSGIAECSCYNGFCGSGNISGVRCKSEGRQWWWW